MALESNPQIILILTVGFALASILGYLSQRLKLSPLLGYLLAGYLIGPYSPGFVADLTLSEQLAEIGVILMMFGVGLHFKWQDLMGVKGIAIPGAIIQTFMASAVGLILIYSMGWTLEAGLVIGLAIGVASTVVLVRLLSDNDILNTTQGHIAVGWLVIEDIFTVIVLILLPVIAQALKGSAISIQSIALPILSVLFKFALLVIFMFTLGHRFVVYVFFKIARLRSHELFTLTVLALIFLIAIGSALIFGISIALGAFIAGMMIGQTEVSHQASVNASPIKDIFVVIFFLSVGMLFNPEIMIYDTSIFLGVLAIILIIKPLTALLIVLIFGYSLKIALTVAVALAQIGEFSFILAEEALRLHILPDEGYDVLVACALISISINPILFKLADYLSTYAEKFAYSSLSTKEEVKIDTDLSPKALVIGFGPIGQHVTDTLEQFGFRSIIIDRNIDTIAKLKEESQQAIYGDASLPEILEAAHIKAATLLVITIPDVAATINVIKSAQQLNPTIQILARTRYAVHQNLLSQLGVNFICCEEEAMKAFKDAIFRLAKLKFKSTNIVR